LLGPADLVEAEEDVGHPVDAGCDGEGVAAASARAAARSAAIQAVSPSPSLANIAAVA
jgi:hypothetical protein